LRNIPDCRRIPPDFAARVRGQSEEEQIDVRFGKLATRLKGCGARVIATGVLAFAVAALGGSASAQPAHGIAMHGEPALPAGFQHLPYANPDAPKGGRITYANVGTFDSMNPFIVRGTSPRGIWDETLGRNVWESLLTRNRAEPFTLYGLLAETVETPPDRSWVEFTIRPEAKFADGEPVKPEDVIFTVELLREKGRPPTRPLLARAVEKVEKVGERGVRFTFTAGGDRELPLLIGLMAILPKHAIDPERFDQTSLTPPLGSGAYAVETVTPGRSIALRRRADYWGKDLPIKRGFDNFDEIRVEYYRDAGAYFDAFKKGLFDALPESDPTRWASQYDFPAAQDGRVVLERFETKVPKPMIGFVFNTRRPVFADPKVREALTYALDFEWLNRALYYGLYQRTGSYFQGSELSALGVPASEAEKALLAPFPGAVRPEVMDGTYKPPESDGSGFDRNNLRKALELLTEAGYQRQGSALVHGGTGEPLTFEILVRDVGEENLALALQRTLAKIGVNPTVRRIEALQYEIRIKSFDFDMIRFTYPSSLSPGNEQINRWSSQAAENQGSFNFSGASAPAIDAMIAAMLGADSREDFVTAVRAFDRVLISGFYLLPLFHSPEEWWARWARIQHPDTPSLTGAEPTTWWVAP
jgi:peptide/nickel transport system substrate-binding protein